MKKIILVFAFVVFVGAQNASAEMYRISPYGDQKCDKCPKGSKVVCIDTIQFSLQSDPVAVAKFEQEDCAKGIKRSCECRKTMLRDQSEIFTDKVKDISCIVSNGSLIRLEGTNNWITIKQSCN